MPSAWFSAIVVAGKCQVETGDAREQRLAVRPAQPLALLLHIDEEAFDNVRRCAVLQLQSPPEVEIGVLPDTRAVIHQANHPHARMVGHRVQQVEHVGGGQLAAQMEKMLGLEQSRVAQRVEIRDTFAEGPHPVLLEPEIAEA